MIELAFSHNIHGYVADILACFLQDFRDFIVFLLLSRLNPPPQLPTSPNLDQAHFVASAPSQERVEEGPGNDNGKLERRDMEAEECRVDVVAGERSEGPERETREGVEGVERDLDRSDGGYGQVVEVLDCYYY